MKKIYFTVFTLIFSTFLLFAETESSNGSFVSGDCGYPDGGSIQLAKNMEQTFLSLGGRIEYRTQVEKVITEQNVFICLGVKADLSDYPYARVIPLKKLWNMQVANGMKFESTIMQNIKHIGLKVILPSQVC